MDNSNDNTYNIYNYYTNMDNNYSENTEYINNIIDNNNNNNIIISNRIYNYYVESYGRLRRLITHNNINNDTITSLNENLIPEQNEARRYLNRCLNCNRSNVNIVCGEHVSDRICVICLESENVCYGCSDCVDRNLPSCCQSCFLEMQ